MSSKSTLGCVLAALVAVVVVALVGRLCVVRVQLGEVGVRTDEWTGGLVKEDFGPGWHRNLGPMHRWVFFDSTVQTLEMSEESFHMDDVPGDSLSLKSSDGNNVDVDVTVKYRIQEGKAYVLYQKKGPGNAYKLTFQQEALNACRTVFGRMKTEDFYDPEMKVQMSQDAKELLTTAVTDLGVEVIDILIRHVRFDPGYERKIQDKKLAVQEAKVNQSKTLAAEQKGITQTVEADTEALKLQIEAEKKAKIVEMEAELAKAIATIQAEAIKYEMERKAQADLYAAEKRAEGQLLVKQAEAAGERLRNEAMAGVGGAIMVALEAAKNLQLGDLVVSTQRTDFLDIEKIVTKLGLPTEEELSQAAAAKSKPKQAAPAGKPGAK